MSIWDYVALINIEKSLKDALGEVRRLKGTIEDEMKTAESGKVPANDNRKDK